MSSIASKLRAVTDFTRGKLLARMRNEFVSLDDSKGIIDLSIEPVPEGIQLFSPEVLQRLGLPIVEKPPRTKIGSG
jgi:hypothetical protein